MKEKKTRRNSVKKSLKKRKKYRLKPEVKLYVLMVIVSVLFIVVSFTVLFKIRNVSVHNCEKYSEQEIIDVSGIQKDSNLLLLNKNEIKKNIYDKFSYIRNVDIIKKLPDSVEMYISLEVPDFFIEYNEEYFLISQSGKVLEKSESEFTDFLKVNGLDLCDLEENKVVTYKNEENKNLFKQTKEAAEKIFENSIYSIDMSNLNKISVNYKNKISIIVGDTNEINYKLLTAKGIIDDKLEEKTTGKLDVSMVAADNTSYFTPIQSQ